MTDLSTDYMGLRLKNPLILGSSSLSGTIDGIKKAEDAGFGAVVLKSIFEEQIVNDAYSDMKDAQEYVGTSDAYSFLENASKSYYFDKYISFVQQAKKSVDIPVIASVNCTSDDSWLSYAKTIAGCGVDALELNYYLVASDVNVPGYEIEKKYIFVARKTRNAVDIPVSMKIGWNFTSICNMVKNFSDIGIDGVVLFNHFFRPDIDIDKVEICSDKGIQPKGDYGDTLRWTAMLSAEIKADICSSTGIRDQDTMIKMILAGAKAVQINSAVYINGYDVAHSFLQGLQQWMDKHEIESVRSFRGRLAQERIEDSQKWERSQYIRLSK